MAYDWLSGRIDPELTLRFPLTNIINHNVATCGYGTDESAKDLLMNPRNLSAWAGKDKPPAAVKWVPGSTFGTHERGPIQREVDVMVIGKSPSFEDSNEGFNLSGDAGRLVSKACADVGLNPAEWYISNVARYLAPTPNMNPQQIKDCVWFLAQEMQMLKPKYLLLLGADAVKAVFGKRETLNRVRSCPFVIPGPEALGRAREFNDREHSALELHYSVSQVFSTIAPIMVIKEQAHYAGFRRDLELFKAVTEGRLMPTSKSCVATLEQEVVDYRYIRTLADTSALLSELEAKKTTWLSLDFEWGYVGVAALRRRVIRCLQISWAPKTAAVFIFNDAGGIPAQSGVEMSKMMEELRKFFQRPETRFVGHNLRSDALAGEEYSLGVMEHMGFDTMLADHSLNENAEHGLEACSVRYTNLGRYDLPLERWKVDAKVTEKDLQQHGYLYVPDDILYPYGAKDADATFRIFVKQYSSLELPENRSVRSCYYNIVLPASIPIHEIERTGFYVDRSRMETAVKMFADKSTELLEKIRLMLRNPTFNPRSIPQMKNLLFGPVANGGFNLFPLKSTGKRSRMWEDIICMPVDIQAKFSPACDLETLGVLSAQQPVVAVIRDFKLIDKIATQFLVAPAEKDDQSGADIFTKGLVAKIDPDGRIRTSLSQMSETGRHKSRDPNLQNLPSKQNKELERIFGDVEEDWKSNENPYYSELFRSDVGEEE